jgi:hypothetical protein
MPRTKKDYAPEEMAPAPDVRWFQEQAELKFGSVQALSKEMASGGDERALHRVLAQTRRLKTVELARLSALLREPPAVILTRLGYSVGPAETDIVGNITADGRVNHYADIGHHAPAPDDTPNLQALLMFDPARPIPIWEDFLIYYERTESVAPNLWGRLAIIKPAELAQPVLAVAERDRSRIAVQVFRGETIESARLDWASPVLWIKCTK